MKMENSSHKTAWNYLQIFWIVLNTIFFNLKNFSKNFREYIRMETLDYKNEDIERKYLKNMQEKPTVFKGKK